MTTKNDDFWGDQADWPEVAEGGRREPRAGAGKTVSRWWNKAVSGGSTANRAHGGSHSNAPVEDLDDEPLSIRHSGEHPVVHRAPADPPTDPARRTPPAALGAQRTPAEAPAAPSGDDADDAWDADWEVAPAPAPRPGIDPLLARIGGAAIVLTLLVPLVLGFGSGDDEPTASADSEQSTVTLSAADDIASTAPAPTTAAVVAAAPSSAAETTVTAIATTEAATVTATPETAAPAVAADEPEQAEAAVVPAASASRVAAERVEQSCAIDYTVVAGDFWIRLSDAAGVPMAQLLDANDATSDTPLFPGSVICLPQGASVPSPPTTAAPATIPPTTARPVATTPPTTAPPATAPPATAPPTAPPVVTNPNYSAAAVQQIIRDVWPDDLEERAIQIADRESNFVVTAQNSCCYGIFQMHWTAHQGWLSGLGITTPQQLFDPTVNARAAYTLYQRAGGWGPWT